MTISALDEIAPERILLGLGSALPLRLGQMGVPYAPDEAAERVSTAIDTLRTLWKGERMPSGKPGLPPLVPQFPPVHRVPIYIAGLAGYLLTLVADTRRDAINRAKREPFVIYMMSILSDVTLKRAGFDPALRDQIAAAWRREDFTTAGSLIPDELLDAFIVCGTRREVADRAWTYHEAGMDLPLLQPVVQDEEQTSAVLDAAVAYGTAEAGTVAARAALDTQKKGAVAGLRDRLGARDRDDRSADRAAPRRVRLPHGRRAPGRRACDAVKTRSSRSVSRRPSRSASTSSRCAVGRSSRSASPG